MKDTKNSYKNKMSLKKRMDFGISSLVSIPVYLLLVCSPAAGQAQQKKTLTESDYGKWGTLEVKAISDQGKWASYAMRYENHNDTLFVHNIAKNKSYAFAKGQEGRFGGDQLFGFLAPESKLKVMWLQTGKIKIFDHVKRYELAGSGQYIITLNKGYNEKSQLKIYNQQGIVIDSISDVTKYTLNATGDALLFAAKHRVHSEVGIINFRRYSNTVLSKGSIGQFYNLVWHKEGKSVAFLNETDSVSKAATVNFFRISDKKMFSFDYASKEDLAKNMAIVKKSKLSISDDGTKVFFMVAKKKDSNVAKDLKSVEIWNDSDKRLFADRQHAEAFGDIPKVVVWSPENDFYSQISDDDLPQIRLSGQQDYAITYNKFCYGLQSAYYYQETDFYLTDIKNGSKDLFLKKQSCDPNQMDFDPYSSKILYYREGNWRVYDPVSKMHTNLTEKAVTNWDNSSPVDVPHQVMPYGIAGWSSDGKNVLLYDANDLWLAAIDGARCVRLTKGREKKIVYRIPENEYYGLSRINYSSKRVIFDLSKDILLEAENTEDLSTGYSIYSIVSGAHSLVYGASKIDEIRKSKNGSFIFQNQTFSQPPRLEFRKKGDTVSKILFESNKQQAVYSFGKSKLLYYSNSKGQRLKAALFYPANYDRTKKYPMVVHIYDLMSHHLNQYVNPSFLNAEGFNVTNYTLNGYFVLMPDIIYEMGNPGISAVDCVTAGVSAVLEKGLVDRSKIGLNGHSFGGYETNFIISQTPIFAAAVSGAGISDIISLYFNLNKNESFRSDMWRFENQQYRIGKSLYDDKEGYCRNSPIMHAENVETPLLLWTGKNDSIVPWNQSITYYLALRRLGAATRMLVYPNEDHTLENSDNKADLSKRMMAWFDHLLKGEAEPEWISKGSPTE
jgi:dipeptidyl aminopeptidase/acylaminoacyl peptidase